MISFPFLWTTVNKAETEFVAVAEIVAVPAPTPVTPKEAVVAPAGTVMLALDNCATSDAGSEARVTAKPFCGAGPLIDTVPVEVPPTKTEGGFSDKVPVSCGSG